MTIEQQLHTLLAEKFTNLAGESWPETPVDPQLHSSRHADFQADAAMGLAKHLRRKPRDIAEEIAAELLDHELLAEVSVAGPGFLNLTLSQQALQTQLFSQWQDERLGVPLHKKQTIIVDYSSPNVAKEMHVGHLRSTIIGDACVRLLEWQGHQVIRRNHIGDWGTPFGMLIEHLLELGEANAIKELSVGDLNTFYRSAREKFEESNNFQNKARARVVALQAGDKETLRLWTLLIEQSQAYFTEVYAQMDVRLDGSEFYGESAYNDMLLSTVDELKDKGLVEQSDGALCVFPAGFNNREGNRLPLIVQKGDGGFGYASTDLAAIRQRTIELRADRLLYVVGAPQTQHLEMVFEVARNAGWLGAHCSAEHVAFGSVLGTDGKMFKSRSGESIKLSHLLNEAVNRAAATLSAKNPQIKPEERANIARTVGIGSVKYADLSSERTRDYVFDFDRMLAFEGNTAPYLQYAHARIRAILRKANNIDESPAFLIQTDSERNLALQLLHFPEVIADVEKSLLFHRLAVYLFELATAFSGFLHHLPCARCQRFFDSKKSHCALSVSGTHA